MREVVRRMQRAAQADCPVVIWGEAGTGKKFMAEVIHRRSRREGAPLVVFRPTDLDATDGRSLEDELFGNEREPGRLSEAEGGTCLIDEITDLPATAQAKLLAAAEGRDSFARAGAGQQPLDFRLMATTRLDPAESVWRGGLREDLHYRIGVVAIHMPPLRERREDLPELIQELLIALCANRAKTVPLVEPDLVQAALAHPWPGNVVQLRDCLEGMMLTGETSTLSADRLRITLAGGRAGFPESRSSEEVATLARLERAAVLHALDVHEGNRTQAARSLGISVRTLQRKLRRWQT